MLRVPSTAITVTGHMGVHVEPRGGAPEMAVSRALTLVFAVGVVLRLLLLGQQSFWYDEAASVALATHGAVDLLLGRARDLGNPPLFPLFLHGWMLAVGQASDAWLRVLPALFGIASLPLVFVVGRRLVGDTAARLATLLFAVAPFQVQLAQETRTYSLLVLLGLLSALGLLRALQEPRRVGAWALHAAATCAMLYAHYFAVFLILAEVVALLGRGTRHRRFLVPAALSFAAAAVGYLLWLPALLAQMTTKGNLGRSAESWYLHVAATPFVYGFGTTLAWKQSLSVPRVLLAGFGAVAFGTALLLGVWAGLRSRRPSLLLWWFVLPIAVPFAVSVALFPLYNVRYVVLGSVPFYMLVALGLGAMGRRLRTVALFGIGLSVLASSVSYFRTMVKPNWRAAVAYVEQNVQPGAVILIDADHNEAAYARYATWPTRRIRMMSPPPGAPASRLFGAAASGATTEDVTEAVLAASQVWLVLSEAEPAATRRYDQIFSAWQGGAGLEVQKISLRQFCKSCASIQAPAGGRP